MQIGGEVAIYRNLLKTDFNDIYTGLLFVLERICSETLKHVFLTKLNLQNITPVLSKYSQTSKEKHG